MPSTDSFPRATCEPEQDTPQNPATPRPPEATFRGGPFLPSRPQRHAGGSPAPTSTPPAPDNDDPDRVASEPFKLPSARGSVAEGQSLLSGYIDGAAGVASGAESREGCEPLYSAPRRNQPPVSVSRSDWEAAQARALVCEQYLDLMKHPGMSCRSAARLLGKSVSNFSGVDSPLARFERGGVAALLPERRGHCGRKREFDLPAWFVPAARYFWTLSNRTWRDGSVPEAIRRVISLPHLPVGWTQLTRQNFLRALGETEVPQCPPELRERILARQSAGQPLVPETVARQIRASAAAVVMRRNARNFSLDWQDSPGTQMRRINPVTGDREWYQAGDVVEADDATINFPVCVPWEIRGDKCSEKFGVRVSRFQWLVAIDRSSRFVPAFSYTARPRSSYRGEDVLGLMHLVTAHHGIPREWLFERGVWKSKLVTTAAERMGARLHTVFSPHTKPFIEGLFSQLWTKLSVHFPGAHVGRSQGEEREAALLFEACKAGEKDPRRCFPPLTTALAAMLETITERNSTPVNSSQYGLWVPEDRWEADLAANPIRRLDPASAWLFSPCVRRWTVRGFQVGGRVRVFEDLSVPYDFTAPELRHFDGAQVDCYFDPVAPQCVATVVLAETHHGQSAGQVIGVARQINDVAGYARLVNEWADDPATIGLTERQRNAAAVRRELRAILPRGRRGASVSEVRDGLSQSTRVERDAGAAVKSQISNSRLQGPARTSLETIVASSFT